MLDKIIAPISIRHFFPVIGGVLVALLVVVCGLVYSLFNCYNQWVEITESKASIQTKTDELRQSSDDLTRFIRMYVQTGNPIFAKNYQQVLDIRNGAAPRPKNYEHIYWELTPEVRAERHPDGAAESLQERFEQLPLLDSERELLRQSQASSDTLTEIEMSIFAMMARHETEPELLTQASETLFSDRYLSIKSDVMLPLDTLLLSSRKRYERAEKHLQRYIIGIFAVFVGVLAVFAVVMPTMVIYVRQKVLIPIHHMIENIHSIKAGQPMLKRVFYQDEIGLLMRQFYSMKEQMDRSYQDLEMISFTDNLTGLYNRHYFFQVAQQHLQLALRNKQPLCMLICDVDHFKAVNDTHGHLSGDEVLKHIARLVSSNVRESDVCARFGGEEFVILLNNATPENGMAIGEKIRGALESTPYVGDNLQLSLTISIGIASIDKDNNLNEAIDHADQALYDAKNSGRNRVCYKA